MARTNGTRGSATSKATSKATNTARSSASKSNTRSNAQTEKNGCCKSNSKMCNCK